VVGNRRGGNEEERYSDLKTGKGDGTFVGGRDKKRKKSKEYGPKRGLKGKGKVSTVILSNTD